jgi:4-diphosphocytidyl-2-C-methyl-D-erythritol kinase
MLVLQAHAKVNLYLDIVERYADGYHRIESVMQSLTLSDQLTIRRSPHKISVFCTHPSLNGQKNLAFKAASLLKSQVKNEVGADIHIEKNIPIAAGLAGGSADAAATLLGLNKIWQLNLTLPELLKIAEKIGADVPFCLTGGTALIESKGERITRLPSLPLVYFVVVNPGYPLSTSKIYREYDKRAIPALHRLDLVVQAIQKRDVEGLSANLGNVFSKVVYENDPSLKDVANLLKKNEALGVSISGTGPTIFGLFLTRLAAEKAIEMGKKFYPNYSFLLTHAWNSGVDIIEN